MQFAKQLLSYVTLALAVTSMSLAAPTSGLRQDGSVRKTAPSVIPSIWQQLGQALAPTPYTFTMSLASSDMAGLSARMEQIAASGGEWLTDDELAQYAQPTAETRKAVTDYLTAQGIAASAMQFSKYGDQVTVQTTVGQTAKMFAAQFNTFNVKGAQVARTKEYTIPTEIASHIEDVFPLTNFGQVKHTTAVIEDMPASLMGNSTLAERFVDGDVDALARRATPSSCSTAKVTPQCLKDFYGTSSYARSTGTSRPDVSVMGYIDQYVSQTDLTNFLKQYSSSASSYKIPIITRNGATNVASQPGVEAMLDVETVVSEIYPLTANFIAEGNSNTQGDIFLLTFNDFINNFSSTTRPKVITISYGSDEYEFTSSQANSMCTAAQKLTALGTTIVVSSGDSGVAGQTGDTCPPFVPTYPSGCQYILSVGATQAFSPEVMVDNNIAGFYSGAGASNIFPIPSYQTSQVAAYESAIGTMGGNYNRAGRVFPDLAAQGSKYVILYGGQQGLVGGTSASAPLTASILALVNDKRAKAGKGTIGWANPALYTASLSDITSGGSYGCGTSTTNGFPARAGFDGSAGNGSPMFAAMSAAFGV